MKLQISAQFTRVSHH